MFNPLLRGLHSPGCLGSGNLLVSSGVAEFAVPADLGALFVKVRTIPGSGGREEVGLHVGEAVALYFKDTGFEAVYQAAIG
jgi:hypothetical protein